MRRNIVSKHAIYIACLYLIVAGCKAKKEAMSTSVPTPPPIVSSPVSIPKAQFALADSIRKHQLSFTALSVKAKAAIVLGTKKNDVALSIRIRNNEAIWVSVTAIAGIEVARALITPDSIKLMNKAEGTYLKKPFSFIHDYTADEVNFSMLQAMLTGNCISEFLSGKPATDQNGIAHLSGTVNNLIFDVIVNSLFKVSESHLSDSNSKQELKLAYTGFSLKSGQELPQTVAIRTTSEKNISIDLEYNKPVFNQPIEMPFSIPKRYEIIN